MRILREQKEAENRDVRIANDKKNARLNNVAFVRNQIMTNTMIQKQQRQEYLNEGE